MSKSDTLNVLGRIDQENVRLYRQFELEDLHDEFVRGDIDRDGFDQKYNEIHDEVTRRMAAIFNNPLNFKQD